MSGYQTLLRKKITREKGSFPTDKWFEKIASYVDFLNKKVIDYGCSTGMLSILAAYDGATVLGIDNEKKHIEKAIKLSNEWGGHAYFAHKEIKDMEYPTNHDISLFSMIAHWIGKEEVERIIKHTESVLIFIYRPKNDHYQIPENGTWFPTQEELDKVCKDFEKIHTEVLQVQDNDKKIVLAIYEKF